MNLCQKNKNKTKQNDLDRKRFFLMNFAADAADHKINMFTVMT